MGMPVKCGITQKETKRLLNRNRLKHDFGFTRKLRNAILKNRKITALYRLFYLRDRDDCRRGPLISATDKMDDVAEAELITSEKCL